MNCVDCNKLLIFKREPPYHKRCPKCYWAWRLKEIASGNWKVQEKKSEFSGDTHICIDCSRIQPIDQFKRSNSPQDEGKYVHSCRECRALKALSFRYTKKKKQPIYRNNFDEQLSNEFEYIKGICAICEKTFHPYSKTNKYCGFCHKVCDKIRGILCRVGRNTGEIQALTNIQFITIIAKLFIASKSCCYCGREYADSNQKSVDHIIPWSLGGRNTIDNIAICCYECNMAKDALPLDNWIKLCELVYKFSNKKRKNKKK